MPKDSWDRFEILSKFISTVVLIAIPIVIKYGADSIAQSLERGRLVQSLITDLTQRDTQARRDIALVALDGAIPQKQKCFLWIFGCRPVSERDQVVDVALILLNELAQGSSESDNPILESDTARQIIVKRTSETFYRERFNEISGDAQEPATSAESGTEPSPSDIQRQATSSRVIEKIQPPSEENEQADQELSGVRIVYIQYATNRVKATELQEYLQDQGITAPGIEQIPGISTNNIRYAGPGDLRAAQRLRNAITQNQTLQFDELRDLSESGYTVPAGQFEIWLKE